VADEFNKKHIKKRADPRLLVWAWGALEADFWRYYRLDLNKLAFTSTMSLRRFSVLVAGLPEDSAYVRFLKDRTNRDMAEIRTIDEDFFSRGD
jgi:hypothetical protein